MSTNGAPEVRLYDREHVLYKRDILETPAAVRAVRPAQLGIAIALLLTFLLVAAGAWVVAGGLSPMPPLPILPTNPADSGALALYDRGVATYREILHDRQAVAQHLLSLLLAPLAVLAGFIVGRASSGATA